MTSRTWEHCVSHRNGETAPFVAEYFSQKDRRVLFIGGAGFDPRSTAVANMIAALGVNRRALLLREERPGASAELVKRGDANAAALAVAYPKNEILSIDILDPEDNAIVGAKKMIREVRPRLASDATDVVVDLSALSISISFPLVKYLYKTLCEGKVKSATNIHLFVTPDPDLDTHITPEHADRPMYIPGFDGGASLDSSSASARLWVPQLVAGRREALRRIYDFLEGAETCPILPFPARNLRRGDELIEHFLTELTSTWEVDPRNFIYAAEDEPLDLYRTLLQLDDMRRRAYHDHGGSLMILSPIGSKLSALGALMAALEREFPVVYLETIRYSLDEAMPVALVQPPAPTHVWLAGSVYA